MIETYGKQLENLRLHEISLQPKHFTVIVNISTLKSLHIVGIGNVFNPETIIALAKNCKNLEDICLNYELNENPKEYKEAMDLFFKERKNTLKKLKLFQFCNDKNQKKFNYLENVPLCENVQELNLTECELPKSNLECISQLKELKKIEIKDTFNEYDELFKNIDCANLKYLIIFDQHENREILDILSEIPLPVLERLYMTLGQCY